MHKILAANPEGTDLVHADLTQGCEKLHLNVEGVASECILRLALVQQMEGLSFRETIVRVDDSAMLRYFCRFYDDAMISHSLYATLVNLIRPETWEKINALIVKYARDKKGFKGHKLRLGTNKGVRSRCFGQTTTLDPFDSSGLQPGRGAFARVGYGVPPVALFRSKLSRRSMAFRERQQCHQPATRSTSEKVL